MKTLAPQIPLSRGAPRELLFSSLFMVAACGALSVALVANAADVYPELVRRDRTPDFVTEQTAAQHLLLLLHLLRPFLLQNTRGRWEQERLAHLRANHHQQDQQERLEQSFRRY